MQAKKGDLGKWGAAAANREKQVQTGTVLKEEVAAPVGNQWDEIQEQRAELKEQAIKWKQVDLKFRQNIQINPAGTLLSALVSGEISQ